MCWNSTRRVGTYVIALRVMSLICDGAFKLGYRTSIFLLFYVLKILKKYECCSGFFKLNTCQLLEEPISVFLSSCLLTAIALQETFILCYAHLGQKDSFGSNRSE